MNIEDEPAPAPEIIRETDDCIRANPMPAVLTAFGCGLALGLAIRLLEGPRKREPLHDVLDELRGLLATGAKRGRRAYADWRRQDLL